PDVHAPDYEFEIGRAVGLRPGSEVTLIANGTMVCRALEAASLLESDGICAGVVNMSTVRPLDRQMIHQAAIMGPIVTIEEHTTAGGLGGAVAEVVAQSHPVRMKIMGFPAEFAPTGSAAFLFEHFGLTPQGIRDAAAQLLEENAGVAREAHLGR